MRAALSVAAPVAGRVVPLSEIPDPVFSQGMVGPGIGLEPTAEESVAVAPIDGVLSLVPALLYLKLLVGHMVPEAPLVATRPQRRATAEDLS